MELTMCGIHEEIKRTIDREAKFFNVPADTSIFEETMGVALPEEKISAALQKIENGEVSIDDAIHSFQSYISFHVRLHMFFLLLGMCSDKRKENVWDDPVKHGLLKE